MLATALARELDLATRLDLAIALTSALIDVHERGLVHRGVQPSCVRVEVPTRRAWLLDAGDEVIGLPYMAPEQTGRMHRAVDWRSDLYSLGVVLYELVAGALPWVAANATEWVHSHVARRPAALPATVPAGLAAIIEKLLAKVPDERYQTAAGLQADLVRVRDALRSGSTERFALGEHEVTRRLRVLGRTYGRADAVSNLLAAIERATTTGAPELVLISGPSGIGKSALVEEAVRSPGRARGLICTGKYDQYKRDIPYATLASALADLVRQLLGRPNRDVAALRIAIGRALGEYTHLACQLIPALALLFDSAIVGSAVATVESKGRVHQTLATALVALAKSDHSLTIFIDDLQWSDQATLEFLRYFFAREGARSVVIVGAYRDNELAAHAVLSRTLEAIRSLGPAISEIRLGPLGPAAYGEILADMLQTSPREVEQLAELVHEKTGGNPFFAIHFATTLVEDGVLRFDPASGAWQWSLAQLSNRSLTHNVVDLLIATLQRLPDALRASVIALACLGTNATTSTMCELLQATERELEAVLVPAVRLGLIVRSDESYTFAHDRVQEAAHQLASAEERARLHLEIARTLRRRPVSDRSELVFELASHYNDAARLVVDAHERVLAAEADLAAAERARASGAYSAATSYIAQALAFLGPEAWTTVPELAARSELVAAHCDHLEARLESAARRLELLARRARDPVLLAEVARTRGEVSFARGQVPQALATCVEFLRQVGIEWPSHPTPSDVRAEYDLLLRQLAGRPVDALADLPEITDPLRLACANVLSAMVSPAGVTADRSVMGMTLLRMVTFAIEHGLSASAAIAFARVPEILIVNFEDWERALGFGSLTTRILVRPMFAARRGRVQVTSSVTAEPFTISFAESRARLGLARQQAFAAGDVTYHNIAIINEVSFALAAGEPLARMVRQARDGIAVIDQTGFGMMQLAIRAEARLAERLAGETVTEVDPAMLAAPGHRLGTLNVRARDMVAATLLGDHAEAIAMIPDVEPLVTLAPMRLAAQDFHFAAAVSLMALDRLEPARRHVARFVAWGAHGEANYGARMVLLSAEVARLEQRGADAGRLYDEAIALARARKSLPDEGVASERAEHFYAALGTHLAARAYRANGHRAWASWGAHGKLRRLDPGGALPEATRPDAVRGLGMARLATMAQAVTSEIDLDRLAARVLSIALEEGGAIRGRVIIANGPVLTTLAVADLAGARSVRASYTPDALAHRALEARELMRDDTSCKVALPFINQGRLVGLLLLESGRPFAVSRLSVLTTLAGLSAVALEHARLYAELRAAELHRAEAERLSRTGSLGWNPGGDQTWSAEALAIYGYGSSTERSLTDRVHPDDRDRITRELASCEREICDWTADYRIILPDGEVRHLHLEVRNTATTGGAFALSGAIVDVTAAKQLAASLDASRSYYAVMLASIADGVVVADEAERVTFMNRAAERLTGWTQADAIGMPYARIVATVGDSLVARDGTLVPLDEKRSALLDDARQTRGVVSVIRDATEQRTAARAEGLALVNERIGLALRGSSVGVWWLQLVAGEIPGGGNSLPIHTVNMWESVGWSTEHDPIIGGIRQPHPERVHADDRGSLLAAFVACLRGETPSIEVEVRLLHITGSWRWFLVRGRAMRDRSGQALRLTGSTIEITDRYLLEHEIRLARDAAEAANRAKDEFLANVSHEVRTPMNAILGMTELALSTQLGGEQRPWLTTVKSSADNLLVIIDELLDYSKAEANKLELTREPFSIRAVLGETLRALAVRAHRRNLELIGDVAPAVPELAIGDRIRIQQILTNLIGNAIKFTAAGEISVQIEGGAEGELIAIVRDTGIGIAKDKQRHVFEPFAQEDASTTRRFGGTGLGLTIAARLAALMGGGIELESTPGLGSAFTVRLWLGIATAPPRPSWKRAGRVLLAEANATLFAKLASWCEQLGLVVVAAEPADLAIVDARSALRPTCPTVALIRVGDVREEWATLSIAKPVLAIDLERAVRELTEPASAMEPAAPTEPQPIRRRLRILVGEDNDFNADLVRELLTRRGHDVEIIGEGHGVLARAISARFDLLLLDLHMPGIDGFEVVRAIRDHERATGAHLPVVALTARSRREDRDRCIAAGMDEFLSKPLQTKLMFETIERLTA